MAETKNGAPKWAIQVLVAVVMLLIGGAAGTFRGEGKVDSVEDKIDGHLLQSGHAVIETRVNGLDRDIAEIKEDLKAIRGLLEGCGGRG